MDTELKVKLERAIKKFVDNIVDDPIYVNDELYWTETLTARMTDAAELVYDQNRDTQKYLREQEVIK